MADRLSALISSTARDLPAHRKEVGEACLRQGVFPLLMEHLPASDAEAVAVSLKLVDEAGLYLGVFGHRYGYVPAGQRLSITEMEYDRAVERRCPRLIFLMHDDHPVRAADVEKGEGAVKLEAFKQRLGTERVVNYFKSPEDLRGQVIDSLSRHRPRDLTALHRAIAWVERIVAIFPARLSWFSRPERRKVMGRHSSCLDAWCSVQYSG